jgi:hypothetical protein
MRKFRTGAVALFTGVALLAPVSVVSAHAASPSPTSPPSKGGAAPGNPGNGKGGKGGKGNNPGLGGKAQGTSKPAPSGADVVGP